MEAFATGRGDLLRERPEQVLASTTPPVGGCHDRVQEEGACPTAPPPVDEAAQLIALESARNVTA